MTSLKSAQSQLEPVPPELREGDEVVPAGGTYQGEARDGGQGSAMAPLGVRASSMSGTANQVEWAERIKRRVNDDFDRVAASFRSVAARQSGCARADTDAIIAILEEKRAEVMSRDRAGYFIHDWQEIGGQVRQMIFHDVRYQEISRNRLPRKRG